MNKGIYWTIGIVLLLLIGVGVWMVWPSTSSPTPIQTTNDPFGFEPPEPAVVATQNTYTLQGKGSATIKTKDFLRNPVTRLDPLNSGSYTLGPSLSGDYDFTASTSPAFVIDYAANTNFFNVTLLREPLSTARKQAEDFLIQTLNISRTQLCELRATVAVPASVNPEYAGNNLGFMYCKGSIALP